MRKVVVHIFDEVVDKVLPKKAWIRVCRHILHHMRGEQNFDPTSNGEYRLLRIVQQLGRNHSPILFDVGANVGAWCITASRGMTGKSTIYAFEPSSVAFARLRESIEEAPGPPVIVPVNLALGDAEGYATLYVVEECGGVNSLHQRLTLDSGWNWRSSETVTVCRGDTFCERNGIDSINFLKIDTEGHELSVLRGFQSMIEAQKIDLIQFEYGHTWIDARVFLKDAFDLLTPHGYKIGKILPKEIDMFEKYDPFQETFAYANFLAVREALVPTIVASS